MIGDTNRVGLRVSTETIWGEVPATPVMQALRYTGETLAYVKETTISAEIRSDTQVPDVIQTGVSAEGNINFELSCKTYDVLLAQVLRSTFTTISLSGLTLTVAAGAKTITRSAGSWITDGVVVGTWIQFGAFANGANNTTRFRVSVVTALVLTVEDAGAQLVNEGPTAACTAKQRWIRNGVLSTSSLIELAFLDINQFEYFQGCRLGGVNLSLTAKSIITGVLQIMAKIGASAGVTRSASVTAQTTTDALAASTNVGTLNKNGTSLVAGIKSATVDAKNNLRHQPVIGQLANYGIGYGRFEVSGVVEIFVEDMVLFQDMVLHNTVELAIPLTDAAGNSFIITIPAIKFTKGNPEVAGANNDVIMKLDYMAKLDPVTGCMLQIDTIS